MAPNIVPRPIRDDTPARGLIITPGEAARPVSKLLAIIEIREDANDVHLEQGVDVQQVVDALQRVTVSLWKRRG